MREQRLARKLRAMRRDRKRELPWQGTRGIENAEFFAGLALAIWIFAAGDPWWPTIVALSAPPAAVALNLWTNTRCAAKGVPFDRRPVFFGLGWWPLLALSALPRAHYFHYLDTGMLWTDLAVAVFGATALAWLPCLALSQPRLIALGVCLVGGFYFYGAIGMLDALLDRSPPTVYRTTVVAKSSLGAGRGGISHYLHLEPWGPRKAARERIALGIYDSVQVGGTVCVRMHPGYFAIRWYRVELC